MKYVYTLLALILSSSTFATTFTVNSLAAGSSGSGTMGTLEYCIEQANLTAGPHTIEFTVAGTIALPTNGDYLPSINSNDVVIDGTSAPGFVDVPVVIIDYTGSTSGHGLRFIGQDCEVSSIEIRAAGFNGITVESTAHGTFIVDCVVRDCGYDGISVTGALAVTIEGNRIGTTADGTTCAMNGYNGLDINGNSGGNDIIDNHIACNGYDGINLDNTHDNTIEGNTIGPLVGNCTSNGYNGIDIRGASTANIIGGTGVGEGNKIAGNLYWGVRIHEAGTTGNIVSGNSISCNDYDGMEIASGGNNGIPPPVISTANTTTITGTSVANADVEVFRSHDPVIFNCPGTPLNQGADYLGSTTADGTGNWSITGTYDGFVVATQTTTDGTSEFSGQVTTGVAASWTNACEGEIIYPVTAPTANFTASSDTICIGECIDFTDLSLDNPDTWAWTFTDAVTTSSADQDPMGICYDSAGVFQVELIASNTGGSNTITQNITVIALPVATITQNGTDLIATAGFASYQWIQDGNTMTGETNDTLTVITNGNYQVVVTNSEGCTDTTAGFVVFGFGIDDLSSELSLEIYPNPSNGYFTFSTDQSAGDNINMLILDQVGRRVYSGLISENITEVDLSHLSSGIYFVQLELNGLKTTQKIQLIK